MDHAEAAKVFQQVADELVARARAQQAFEHGGVKAVMYQDISDETASGHL